MEGGLVKCWTAFQAGRWWSGFWAFPEGGASEHPQEGGVSLWALWGVQSGVRAPGISAPASACSPHPPLVKPACGPFARKRTGY